MVYSSLTLLAQNLATKYKRRFIDSLRIYVKGGSGGAGYPKYGGIGGSGGNVYVVGSSDLTLKDVYRKNETKRYNAGHGDNSHSRKILGQKGTNLHIKIPKGITVYDQAGRMLGEINENDEELLVAMGAPGGCKETGFSGVPAEGQNITLDLKLLADVGLVGFPNAGKSTLLAAVSNAKPKIASYPFTTITPNIGIINFPDLRQITVADLPGLIEGAHINVGMGHKFLKHVERTKLLLILVDVAGFKLSVKHQPRTCLETILLLNKELEMYREELLNKPAVLVINKMDLPCSQETFETVKESIDHLEDFFSQMPKALRPITPLRFKDVLGVSLLENNNGDADKIKDCLREVLDQNGIDLMAEIDLAERIDTKYKIHGPRLI